MYPDRRFALALYRFRLAALGGAAFLLPLLVPMTLSEGLALALIAPALLTWWTLAGRWFGPGLREQRVTGLASILEGLAIALLVAGYGGPASPFLLLYMPLGVQIAGVLAPAGALAAGAVTVAAAAVALVEHVGTGRDWRPTLAAVGILWIVALAWWSRARRRSQRRERQRVRRQAVQRAMLARVLRPGEPFWPAFLAELRADGGYEGAAVLRFQAGRPEAIATDRPEAWRGLAARHAELLRRRLISGTPEVFAEGDHVGRTIVCFPVPRRADALTPGALLCVLIGERAGRPRLDLAALGRRLEPWLLLAGVAAAALEPRLTLRRAPVDWRPLVDAVVRRLDRRLAGYMVMVDVEEGTVEADGALLADALAHLVEEAVDRLPRGSRVHLRARREGGAWNFVVETAAPTADVAPVARPGLRLARQVVAAHGGRWESRTDDGVRRWGFRLPSERA